MRDEILNYSLRGIQRARLRGLSQMRGLTDPMIAGANASVSSDVGTAAARTVLLTMPFSGSSSTSTHWLSTSMSPWSREYAGTLARDTTFEPPRFYADGPRAGGSSPGDPLDAAGEVETAVELAEADRGASDGTIPGGIYDDSARGEEGRLTPSATPTLWDRYKWWILGLLLVSTGAGGWMVWRMARRRR
jgi:hypothetical protein